MNTPTPRGTVPIDSITDTSRGIYAVTGPCSMSSPCPGESCPEHGSKASVITVEPYTWRVRSDAEIIGSVVLSDLAPERWYAYDLAFKSVGISYSAQADAVAAVVAEHAKPQPEPCPTCGQAVAK